MSIVVEDHVDRRHQAVVFVHVNVLRGWVEHGKGHLVGGVGVEEAEAELLGRRGRQVNVVEVAVSDQGREQGEALAASVARAPAVVFGSVE